ncbi:MAG: hypothetical protein EOO45_00075 [Flavobacterium sp.]|nr:MAG: hypothetical protein EOO45_00075 [Flavobacterium sp.]
MSVTDHTDSTTQNRLERNNLLEYQEYDLIDVIGFFWKSRLSVLLGLIIGLVIAALILILNQYTTSKRQNPSRELVIQMRTQDPENLMPELSTLQLNSFLNSEEGARSFYVGMATSSKKSNIIIEEWVKHQLNNQGMINKLENISGDISFIFRNIPNLTDDELKIALPIALNEVVSRFNNFVGKNKGEIVHQKIETQIKLDLLKIKAIQLFQKESSLSNDFKKIILAGIVDEIVIPTRIDGIAFLLSSVPDSNEFKANILSEYVELFTAYDILLIREQNFLKKYRLSENSSIMKIALANNLHIQEVEDLSLRNKLIRNPIAILSLGAIFGAMAGIGWAIFLIFYRNNKTRLGVALQRPS